MAPPLLDTFNAAPCCCVVLQSSSSIATVVGLRRRMRRRGLVLLVAAAAVSILLLLVEVHILVYWSKFVALRESMVVEALSLVLLVKSDSMDVLLLVALLCCVL